MHRMAALPRPPSDTAGVCHKRTRSGDKIKRVRTTTLFATRAAIGVPPSSPRKASAYWADRRFGNIGQPKILRATECSEDLGTHHNPPGQGRQHRSLRSQGSNPTWCARLTTARDGHRLALAGRLMFGGCELAAAVTDIALPRTAEDHLGALLRDHDRRRACVAGGHDRHNGRIHDAQRSDAVHPQLRIDDGESVRSHLGGAHRMEDRRRDIGQRRE